MRYLVRTCPLTSSPWSAEDAHYRSAITILPQTPWAFEMRFPVGRPPSLPIGSWRNVALAPLVRCRSSMNQWINVQISAALDRAAVAEFGSQHQPRSWLIGCAQRACHHDAHTSSSWFLEFMRVHLFMIAIGQCNRHFSHWPSLASGYWVLIE